MSEVTTNKVRSRRSQTVPANRVSGRYPRSGAIAGATSAVGFAIIHHIFISDIWFSLLIMMVAGALCGLCVAWSYSVLSRAPSFGGWLRYNTVCVVLLALLAVASVLTFDPVTTMAALIVANGPPHDLIGQAMPMTAIFTALAAVVISMLYERGRMYFAAILLTCIVIVLFLGLNISAIGLVDIPRGSLYLVLELFGLIVAINVVYVAAFAALERRSLLYGGEPGPVVTGAHDPHYP